jgi:hypothetical protein
MNPPVLALIREVWEVPLVFVATWVLARIERRRVLSFGCTGGGKLVRLVSGAARGFASLSVLIGVFIPHAGWWASRARVQAPI